MKNLAVLLAMTAWSWAGTLTYYQIALGQPGDAEFLILPGGKTVLIDGGPDSTNGLSNPVIAFLEALKITRVDFIVMSHPHTDHMAGEQAVLQRYSVGTLYDTGVDNPGTSLDNTIRTLAGSRRVVLTSTGTLDWGDPEIQVRVLHVKNSVSSGDMNDASIVLHIRQNNSTFIFGGDAGDNASNSVEPFLVANHSAASLRADVYKVHHHGSATSSTSGFLSALSPQLAVIGVNQNNTFGHPTAEALNRIAAALPKDGKKRIWRTDQDGNIQITTTGDGTYAVNGNFIPAGFLASKDDQFVNIFDNLFNPDRGEFPLLQYSAPNAGATELRVLTMDGQEIYRAEESVPSAGVFNIAWRGRNSMGETVAPGVYVLWVKTPGKTQTHRAILVR